MCCVVTENFDRPDGCQQNFKKMPNNSAFEHLNKNLTKYEFDFKKYVVPSLISTQSSVIDDAEKPDTTIDEIEHLDFVESFEEFPVESESEEEFGEETINVIKVAIKKPICALENLSPFQKSPKIERPQVCIWSYLCREDLEFYLKLKTRSEMREYIDKSLGEKYPKGCSRTIATELIYSVTKFCKSAEMNLEKTGALLSMFYLTHRYFTSMFIMSAEKVYKYFKDILVLHCLEYEPHSVKIFNYGESRKIMLFFCSVYLRNLPLIKLLATPNYGLRLNYELEPDPKPQKPKKQDKKMKLK